MKKPILVSYTSLNVPAEEISKRITGLQERINQCSIQGVLIVQRMDLLYFSGCAQNAFLFVPESGEPLLLVRKYAPRAANESPIKRQVEIRSIREIPDRIHDVYGNLPRVLGLAWDVLPFREFQFYKKLFSSRAYVDVSGIIHKLRSVKSPWERTRVNEATLVCFKTLQYLESKIAAGMNETHIAGYAEAFVRQHGHGSGIRVRTPDQDDRSCIVFSDNSKISDKLPTSVSFRAVSNGYHAVKARPFIPDKRPGALSLELDHMKEVHASKVKAFIPGVSIDQVVKNDSFRKTHNSRMRKDFHVEWSLHGVGLELFEQPFAPGDPGLKIEPGMCLALETSLTNKKGICLSMAETFVIEEYGSRSLDRPGV
jgi:Xaa-Pro aminopeptidase